jgi:ATP synthase protein I
MTWQAIASVVAAAVAGVATGHAGALSALLGGSIGIAAALAYALMSRSIASSPALAVRIALRAEAVKLVVVVLLLWFAFTAHRGLEVLPFFGAFVVSILLSGIAFVIRPD